MAIPPPVSKVYVYKPLDAGLLSCKTIPTTPPEDDLDLGGALNRAVDAWADCWKRVQCIAKLYAEKPCDPKALGIKE